MEEIKLACLGLSFKPDIDDLRESPALQIVEKLASTFGGKLLLVEPNIADLPDQLREHMKVDLDFAIENADVLVLLVAHRAFKNAALRLNSHQMLVAATEI
jgi:UDP-N-acetyl-D-mannosaminuronic acid dehydrogenase